ncbi:uncharacterized protein LOC107490023 [Arachis duranensis]|uniref:Uncharacterized protein LOC107490023 n=1 Tax=Arachis duranensis TaxID=130453 RepID=A0A6P4DD05_ARADU|nr:uncharacterized protein LOC107490023 [Arachis duranensis]
MHAKCVIKNNDEVEIRPNKTFLALANEAGGPSNLEFSEKELRNYITARLQTSNVNADVREVMNYFMRMKNSKRNFFYAVKLGEECMDYHLHRSSVSTTMEVRCECNLFEISGVLCCYCLAIFHSYKVYKVPTCYVLPRWSKKIKRKHTYIKSSHDVNRSDVSHNVFRGLCAHFYNIAQEFVNDDDETALLHAALDETRAKLIEHRAKKRSESVVETHTSIGSQNSNVIVVVDIQGPLLVTTKGRPKSKRPRPALEKSFKKSGQRKNKNAFPVVRSNTYPDTNFGDTVGRNAPKEVGSFMSLLNSFDKS